MELDEDTLFEYMRRAIELGKKAPIGIRKPHVGAIVLSASGEIAGEGYKTFIEGTGLLLHAERVAIDRAGEASRGGCLITTLEPCARISDTQLLSSCSELIVQMGIQNVVMGLVDTSISMQKWSGIRYLLDRGVNVLRYTANCLKKRLI